jgi:hypothetical protein
MSTTVSNNMIAFNGGSFAFRNKIINGDMLIAQRGTTFSVAVSSQYTVDRWNVSSEIPARPGRGDITQSNDVPNFEFQSSLRFTTTTISNANTQFLEIEQYIEGYDARDLINQPIIVSFWVKSNKTGTYSVHLNNAGNGVTPDRSYVAEYNINTNNWEKKTIYVSPIDASQGVWNWTNGRGLKLGFTLAGASSNVAPLLNSWVTGDFITSSNQTNLLDTTGNTFLITGVQLEKGPTPTPFEHRPFGTELASCQRYFEKSYNVNVTPGTASVYSGAEYSRFGYVDSVNGEYYTCKFVVTKRNVPAVIFYSPKTGLPGVWSDTSTAGTPDKTVQIVTPGGGYNGVRSIVANIRFIPSVYVAIAGHWTADAEL